MSNLEWDLAKYTLEGRWGGSSVSLDASEVHRSFAATDRGRRCCWEPR